MRASERSATRRFWVRWYGGADDDPRPVVYPTPIEWWCTGYDMSGRCTICGIVDAANECDAWDLVVKHWPEAERSSMQEKDPDWRPRSDRFPPFRAHARAEDEIEGFIEREYERDLEASAARVDRLSREEIGIFWERTESLDAIEAGLDEERDAAKKLLAAALLEGAKLTERAEQAERARDYWQALAGAYDDLNLARDVHRRGANDPSAECYPGRLCRECDALRRVRRLRERIDEGAKRGPE